MGEGLHVDTDDVAAIAAGVPGTVLVVIDGEAWSRGPLGARYPIYSLTKPVIGAAVVQLVRDGRVSLEDPAPLGWPGTLRHLLNHTSGARNYAHLPAYDAALQSHPREAWSDDELLGAARAAGPDFEPGHGWAYSNTGYTLLRIVLDAHGGIAAFLPRLELAATNVASAPDDLLPCVPALWALPGEEPSDVRGRYDPRWVGHRTLIATAADLLPFWQSLPAELLDPATFVSIGAAAPGFADPRYGLGVMTDPSSTLGTVIGHGGGGPGYAHGVFTVPSRNAVVIVLTHDQRFDAQGTALRLLQAALNP